jgi:hypothetical protein
MLKAAMACLVRRKRSGRSAQGAPVRKMNRMPLSPLDVGQVSMVGHASVD